MPASHAKMCLKSASQKLNFLMAKGIKRKIYTKFVATNALARFRVFTHCYATSFSRKTILCETNNIFYNLGNQKWDKTNNWSWKYIKNKYKVTLDRLDERDSSKVPTEVIEHIAEFVLKNNLSEFSCEVKRQKIWSSCWHKICTSLCLHLHGWNRDRVS